MSQSFIKKPDNGPHSALAGLGVLRSEPLAPEEWKRQCAARYMDRAGVEERVAMQMAETAWEEAATDRDNLPTPQEAADADMDCWEDDGDGE